ncbi:AAA-like domain-containing protein, partial [Nodularia chucula]|uniref:AAA-like domain-containing protein n=1 Tax=Nodularia chucula TaxID=3093667 RepID=UPI0039C5F0AF
ICLLYLLPFFSSVELTLTKVRRRQSTVDQPSLAAYFEAFGLFLEDDDYIRQELEPSTSKGLFRNQQPTPLKGQLPPTSPFYIYRPPAEKLFRGEIFQLGALVRIRAPRQFGKTSLIAQGLNQATEYQFRTAVISLQLADKEVFSSLSQFLQWLCVMVSRSLDLPNRVEELWNPLFGHNYSCNEYFETYLLAADSSPLLLVLDEVNILFSYSDIAVDFFGMLRAWYEQARHSNSYGELWQRLRIVIVYSTEVLLPLNVHQSPFNVGLLIELPPFTPQQVQELATRYGLETPEIYANELVKLVGGNPYLTQLSLFHLTHSQQNIEQLLATATLPDSIFNSHLRQQFSYLEQHPELKAVMEQVVKYPHGLEVHPSQSFKLQGVGLIRFKSQLAVCSCDLYQKYFSEVLK